MLVEKLICNARLNLLILHPLPTPSKLPRQTEEHTGLSVPRCQEIKISICEWGGEEGAGESASHVNAGRLTLQNVLFGFSMAVAPLSSLQRFIYLHYTSIYQPANKTCHPGSPPA